MNPAQQNPPVTAALVAGAINAAILASAPPTGAPPPPARGRGGVPAAGVEAVLRRPGWLHPQRPAVEVAVSGAGSADFNSRWARSSLTRRRYSSGVRSRCSRNAYWIALGVTSLAAAMSRMEISYWALS